MARNWAITIGINGYRYLQRLDYAMPDADAVRHFFTDELRFHQVYHFTDTSPPILQDHGPDLNSQPTSTTLGRFLRTRFEKPFLHDGDNLWFFFAGHGIRHNNRDYLMPLDGDRDDLERSAIPLHYISERLRRSGADNIILLIDACRSYEGKRDGFGIGREKQQGVITLFSCSPEESSYEIQELQQGVFTYVLLDSLRLQGEGNCATVERLYHRLRRYVPQITRQYKRVPQTPYGVIEPPSKNHLILLPRQASLTDVVALKNDALAAELAQDSKTAKRLWIRVLMVSPGDSDAIIGIERLSRSGTPPTPEQQNKLLSHPASATTRAAIPVVGDQTSTFTQKTPTEISVTQLVNQLPGTLRPEAATIKSTEPVASSSTGSPKSVGEKYRKYQNLRPSTIGLIVFGVISFGLLLLGILLGRGDPTPTVADTETQSEPAIEPLPAATESVPIVTNAPVSKAPMYVEGEATEESFVSVTSDGVIIFEGVMQPGDTMLWEAESEIDVYSGNAGGLTVSVNGQPSEVLGESGQLGNKVFSVE